jgi:YD repeat-containing protein
MRIRYDLEVDALYIRLLDRLTEVRTERISEDVAVDYDASGHIVGIEVLGASEYLAAAGTFPR